MVSETSEADLFVAALDAEEVRLHSKLHQNPDYRRLVAIREVLRIYRETRGANSHPSAKSLRSGSVAALVIEISETYLRGIGRRAQTPELASRVQEKGILVDAANVIAAVSSYLSQAKDRFDNVRGEGYGLVEWQRSPSDQALEADLTHSYGSGLFPEGTEEAQAG